MSSNTIIILAKLYDATCKELQEALASQTIIFNDNRIKDKVVWLGEIAKTLSLVSQIEKLRGSSSNSVEVPPEQQAVEDPAVAKAKKGQFKPNVQGLGNFEGWKPF